MTYTHVYKIAYILTIILERRRFTKNTISLEPSFHILDSSTGNQEVIFGHILPFRDCFIS